MASCFCHKQMWGLVLGAPKPDVSTSPQQTTSILAPYLADCKSHEHILPGSSRAAAP